MTTSTENLIQSIHNAFACLRGIVRDPDEMFQIISRMSLLKWASDNRGNNLFGNGDIINVPSESTWEYIKKNHQSSQYVISMALDKLFQENPWLLNSMDNEIIKRLLKVHPEISSTMVDIFSYTSFDIEKLPSKSTLGDIFSNININLAYDIPNSGFAAESVRKLLVSIINPEDNSIVYDPFLSRGFIHQEVINYIISKESSIKNLRLLGQEINYSNHWLAFFIALMYCLRPDYQLSNAFIEPIKNNKNEFIKADFVISMPPIGVKKWGREIAQFSNDNITFRYGLPSSNSGDIAAIEIALAHLNENGRCGIITATGVLFRGGSEGDIRKEIINADLVEAVISLPGGLLFGSGIPLALIIFNKNKPAERKGKILLVDYSDVKIKRSGPKELPEEISGEILNLYEEFKEKTGFARIVSMDEIASKEYNLNISGYIQKQIEIEKIEMTEAIEKIQALESERLEIVSNLMGHLKKFN